MVNVGYLPQRVPPRFLRQCLSLTPDPDAVLARLTPNPVVTSQACLTTLLLGTRCLNLGPGHLKEGYPRLFSGLHIHTQNQVEDTKEMAQSDMYLLHTGASEPI